MQFKANKEDVWFFEEDIPQDTVFMVSAVTKFFVQDWPRLGLGDKVKKYFTLFRGTDSQMCYVRKEFEAESEFLAGRMLKDPSWALAIIKKVENWSLKFFKLSREQKRLNLRALSDEKLLTVFKLPQHAHLFSHGIGGSVSWHADADKERVSKTIINMIAGQIKAQKLNLAPAAVFSILSTPHQKTLIEKEELAFLDLGQQILQSKKAKEIFNKIAIKDILPRIQVVNKKLYQNLIKHINTYCWLPFQYRGPAYQAEDFIGRFLALVKGRQLPLVLRHEIISRRQKLRQEQEQLTSRLKFNSYQKKHIALAQALVYIKDLRKMALYHGMYCYEAVLREIGRRLGLSLDQMWAMRLDEVGPALLSGRFDVNELNARNVACAVYYDQKSGAVLTGADLKKFLASIRFEKTKIKNKSQLTGTCACPGLVQGQVKIINLPEEMVKMKIGDILVAHSTNPNLVPAMRKASAIISEAGGLTCHAAIVAREMGKPCVVGVKNAIRVLKDGDKVEVDATKGIIKKLKK